MSHTNESPVNVYEVVVVGAGQVGDPLARACARAGRRTALIERDHLGGTCTNRGCTPTKTLQASARIAHLARRAPDFGVRRNNGVTIDMPAVQRRKQAIIDWFRRDTRAKIEETPHLDLVGGSARFTGPHQLAVTMNDGGDTRTLRAPTIVIDTGARPAVPSVDGLENVPFLDSTSILELNAVPRHLLILGGNYIGLEFAQMFRRLGSQVTLIEAEPHVLSQEDEDVCQAVEEMLSGEEIELVLGATAARADHDASGVCVTLQNTRQLRGSHLLIATGQTPNTNDLGLEEAGVATDEKGYVCVDEQLRSTTAPGVWAGGDVVGGPAFTHITYDDFRVLRANLLEDRAATTTGRLVPYTVYVDPQLGRVGLSERAARAAGKQFRVARLPMNEIARAIEAGETTGFLKALVEDGTNEILGCAVFGAEGGEIMSLIEVAMMGKLPYTALRDGVFAHPTLAEGVSDLFRVLDEE